MNEPTATDNAAPWELFTKKTPVGLTDGIVQVNPKNGNATLEEVLSAVVLELKRRHFWNREIVGCIYRRLELDDKALVHYSYPRPHHCGLQYYQFCGTVYKS